MSSLIQRWNNLAEGGSPRSNPYSNAKTVNATLSKSRLQSSNLDDNWDENTPYYRAPVNNSELTFLGDTMRTNRFPELPATNNPKATAGGKWGPIARKLSNNPYVTSAVGQTYRRSQANTRFASNLGRMKLDSVTQSSRRTGGAGFGWG